MSSAQGFMPQGFEPAEEEVFGKAFCPTCEASTFKDARDWAHQHVRQTGHAVELHFGYDIRDKHWFDRLSYEEQAEVEALRGDPKATQALVQQILRGRSR